MTLRRITILAALLAALALLAGTFVCAATPAGTNITAQASATYKNSAGASMPTVTSNSVTVKVGNSLGVSINVPGGSSRSFSAGQPGGVAFTVSNTGNAAATFSLSATSDNSAVAVQIINDANGDGVLQSTETTVVSTTNSISAGGSAKLIAKVTASGAQTANLTLTAKSTADATKIATAKVAVTFAESKFIRTWLINGYYTNSNRATLLSKDYLGMESLCAPKVGDTEGGKVWSAYQSTSDKIDFVKIFSDQVRTVAYACVYINAPAARDARLLLGSDDGVKVWLNGEVVWTNDINRGCSADSDNVPIKLKQGWNRLLVKVRQESGPWKFMARIADASGNPISGVTTSIDTGDRVPPTISNLKVSSVTENEAVIEWDTDEPSTTEVGYGILSTDEFAYGDPAFTTHHIAKLTNLKAETTYQVKVYSADMQNNIGTANTITFSTAATQSEPEPEQPTSAFVTDWIVNGYYSNSDKATRLSRNYLPSETSIYPYPGFVSNNNTWKKVTAGSDGKVDLISAFGSRIDCAAYAHIYFYSPVAQTVNVLVGSDDGVKIWHNGKVVWNNDVYRGFKADEDKFQISLHNGWQRMLVKLSQGNGNWGFSLRFTDRNGNPVNNLTYKIELPW